MDAFEHASVQQVVGLGMRCAMCLQRAQLFIEGHPFRDTRGQLAATFEFLKNLKIIPAHLCVSGIGIVLCRSDAPLGQLLKRSLNGLTATVMRGPGNDRHHRIARGFAQDASGLSG